MLPSKTLVASQQAEHQPLKQVQGSRLEEWIQKKKKKSFSIFPNEDSVEYQDSNEQ